MTRKEEILNKAIEFVDKKMWCYLEDILPTKKGGSKWR